jgi:hypothetical protein
MDLSRKKAKKRSAIILSCVSNWASRLLLWLSKTRASTDMKDMGGFKRVKTL